MLRDLFRFLKLRLMRLLGFEKPGPRLRHVLTLGARIERRGEQFYRRFAGELEDPRAGELCNELADDEARHLRTIEEQLAQWNPIPLTQRDLEQLDADGRLSALFRSPPGPDATAEEILHYARNEEDRMVAFYARFQAEFADRWKATKLWKMVQEEKSHVKKLDRLIEDNA